MCYGDKRSVKNGIHFHVSQKKVFPVGRDFYFYTLPCRAYDIVYLIFFVLFQCNDYFFHLIFVGYRRKFFNTSEIGNVNLRVGTFFLQAQIADELVSCPECLIVNVVQGFHGFVSAAHKQGRKTYEIVVYLACGTTGDYKPRNVGYCEVKSKQHAERKVVVAICAYFVVKQESEKDDNHSANAYHDCLSELFKSRFSVNILISPLQIV